MNIDMNLLLRIAVFLLVLAFLLVVVRRLTQSPGLEIKENSAMLGLSALSLLGFIFNGYTARNARKGISMPTDIMVLAIIILVVVGLTLLLWFTIAGNFGSALSWVWSKVWPF